MTRKITSAILICILLAAFAATFRVAAKSYQADRFDVQLDVQPDGGMLVTERLVFKFEGGPFTYVFRDLALKGTDGIQVVDASMDGVLLPVGRSAGQVEIGEGDPIHVTWHFNPVSNSTHTYVLHYRVKGVIRTGAADVLLWYAIPQEHDYSIAQSNVAVNYPAGIRPLEAASLDRRFESTPTDQGVRLTASDISDNAALIVTVKFPFGSLAKSMPLWQVKQAQSAAASARAAGNALFSGAFMTALGLLVLILFMRANRRELSLPGRTPLAAPPADIHPAVAGKLAGYEAYGSMGALFSLAQRGLLEIHEEKGFWGYRKFILERRSAAVPLEAYDQSMLEAIFKPGETSVNMNEIGTRLASKNNSFDEPVQAELVRRGWLDLERKRKRTVMLVAGMLVMFGALAGFILGAVLTGVGLSKGAGWLTWAAGAAGICASLFVLSLVLIFYAAAYSVLTPAGEEQKIRWKGFADYLKQVGRGKEPAISPDYFERYLAYAAVFGLGAAWSKYFQKLGGVPLPVWFHALPGSQGDFGSMVAVMSASDSTGASAGAGGAGGASGGGSSGAG